MERSVVIGIAAIKPPISAFFLEISVMTAIISAETNNFIRKKLFITKLYFKLKPADYFCRFKYKLFVYSYFLNTRDALCPQKPNEFDITALTLSSFLAL